MANESNMAATPKRSRLELAFLPAVAEITDTPASPLGRLTLLGISFVVIVGLIWSVVATIDVIATAQGKIIPTGRVQTVQPAETALVRAIHVRDGAKVEAGAILMELEFVGADNVLRQAEQDIATARLERARMMALDGRPDNPLAIYAPPPDADPAAVARERRFIAARAGEHKAQLASLDAELARRRAEYASIGAQIAKAEAVLPLLGRRSEARRYLAERQAGPELAYLEIRQQEVEMEQELRVTRGRRLEAEAGIVAAEAQRRRAEAEFGRALASEIADLAKRLATLTQDHAKAAQRAALQTLVAPVAGTVQQLSVTTLGAVVTAAQSLMVIVPADSRLEVEAMLLNRDVGFVETGMPTVVKIETFNFTKYGYLTGEVLFVSGDAVEDRAQGLVYPTRISLERAKMVIDGREVALSPGMSVTAEIKTERRRLIEYVLTPLLRYRDEALRER
jgi:hemolysin D